MFIGKYVFAQIVEYVSFHDLDKCVNQYHGNKHVREMHCRDQLLAMIFGQLCHRESLRDLVLCLNAHNIKLYHLGFRSAIHLPTLAKANEKRDYRIYESLANILIRKAQLLYLNDSSFPFEMKNKLYIIDSSTIDLCLTLFRWATFRKTKSAVKMHTQIDGRGIIPILIVITKARVSDVSFLDQIVIESNAYYIFDRGYFDYKRLHRFLENHACFVIRAKSNIAYRRLYSNPIDKKVGIRSDQVIKLTGYYSRKHYPEKLRRIKYYESTTQRYYVFITNDFISTAIVIAEMYKYRWQIEIFFKWIKQHLEIISFWGRTENAVKTQIYIATCTYLIVLILRKELKIDLEPYKILQILSISLFDKTQLESLLSEGTLQNLDGQSSKQLSLLNI